MSTIPWRDVAAAVDDHAYMSGVQRSQIRIDASGEVFTPTALVIEILQSMDPLDLAPGKTVLDPACGDGQFLVAVKAVKTLGFSMSPKEALDEIYGVDIMVDNVNVARARLGGGTIVVGDILDPFSRVDGQTDEDRRLMSTLFADAAQGRTPLRRKPVKRVMASETVTLF